MLPRLISCAFLSSRKSVVPTCGRVLSAAEPLERRVLLSGTVSLLQDVNAGPSPYSSSPFVLTEANGLVFFAARDPSTGYELFVTDGTAAGSRLVKDINPGTGDSSATPPKAASGGLYVKANDG